MFNKFRCYISTLILFIVSHSVLYGMHPDTQLKEAVGRGNLAQVQRALADGADVNAHITDGTTALHRAARYGHKDIVELLLAHGADIAGKASNGFTPLHAAIYSGDKDIVQFLIDHGADVNAQTIDGAIPLHIAAYRGYEDILKLLVAHGAYVTNKTKSGSTALNFAAQKGHTDIIKLLINHGADPKVDIAMPLYSATINGHIDTVKLLTDYCVDNTDKSRNQDALLLMAVYAGHKELVEFLVHNGSNVNLKVQEHQGTLLHIAAENGRNGVLELLITNHGLDVNAKTTNGYTPLHVATVKGYAQTVKLLINHGADVNAKTTNGVYRYQDKKSVHMTREPGYTPLHIAADKGYTEIVKLLVDDDNIHERLGEATFANCPDSIPYNAYATPLHLAAGAGHKEIVQFLIDCGADINSTALHKAAENGHKEMVELLINHSADKDTTLRSKSLLDSTVDSGNKELVEFLINCGADVNNTNAYNETLVYKAASYGHKELVELLLLKCGADINIKSSECGMTPLHNAAFWGNADAVEVLIKHGADIESREDDSMMDEDEIDEKTPLIRATARGNYDIVKLLLEHCAQVDSKDKHGDTALDWAISAGYDDIATLLIGHGAAIDGNNSPLLQALNADAHYLAALLLDRGGTIPAPLDAHALAVFNQIQQERQQLTNAVLRNNPAEVKQLLKQGIYAHTAAQLKLHQWYKALLNAIDSDNVEHVKQWSNKGLSLALQESNGDTLLHRAVRKESVQVIKYLLSEGIDTTLVNNNGETAVHLAANKLYILAIFFDHYKQLSKQNTLQEEPAHKKARLS